MPINPTLPDLESPVPFKWGEVPSTEFVEHLTSIDVQLLHAPTWRDLMDYIPRWCRATWSDHPHDNYTPKERVQILRELFEGKVLPSALETIGLVFLIKNIDKVDVTHLLRHRTLSFSAVCSADRDLRHETCLVKNSIIMSEFAARYKEIVEEAKQLYADMVDTRKISMLDARTILPACLEHHYYVRGNIKDIVAFIRQRIDRQIQPESDNIVALKMWIEIVRRYPEAKGMVDVYAPDGFYCKMVPTGLSSNIYMPEIPRNDIMEYKPQWFMYHRQRSQMEGGDLFVRLWKSLVQELEEI
jgi:thymidylate synthase ThyX